MARSAQVIPLHRGFVMRDYRLDLSFADGTVFFGTVSAISHEMAEEVACSRAHQRPEHIVRSDSRPMPLNNGFSDTLPTLDTSSALADMAAALRRSEAMPEDLPPSPSGADFDAYNAAHKIHGQAACATTAARLAPLRRAHTSSSLVDDMRMPLRRRDLWLAAISVALSVAAVLLLRG